VQVSAARIALDQHAATPDFDNDFALVVSGVGPGERGAGGLDPKR
jgi:hypothetical protein